ncbi:MerR family transcriptional regulator [Sediminivirga luteola]|uniref:Transcriptional regulator, MerR family protein n=1 Tax=Sediminivirga luteola TaxID=1774748 RepID=A0A8J2TZ88_9MICO|nr:MerR family transcriptional regulator [Sediminivirga luteola]MCI2267176.1 MerR family transcriptional regulator [Sediminivirga luteola]GGA19242.1 transcriptional regulator, MerR family protein [Sediminivirga luteola]
MGWSTREVAKLAGTTLRTVRHYHDIGLLEEPERLPNGYKSYRTVHLVRLLEIRRLTRLGLSLSAIATVLQDPADLNETLDAVQDDLAETIAQLQLAQEEIAKLRRTPTGTDLPFDIAVAAKDAELSDADRSLYAVITQVAGDKGHEHWSTLLKGAARTPASEEFDALPADADEETRHRLAEQLAPQTADLLAQHPLPADARPGSIRERELFARTVIEAMTDLYNPAQLDVIARIWRAIGIV